LNFFLKYLQKTYATKAVASIDNSWLGDEDEELDGFKWDGGSKRVTSGIHIWNEVFLHDYEDGRKVAILLMDTQGTFDNKTTMKDCTTIFALSTLLSSVQIYNISNNLQEDQLQYLQYFSEYGRMASKTGDKPFQKLMILVRDWFHVCDHAYGSEGGQELLDDFLSINEEQEEEHKSLRQHIMKCFDEIECFLMPFPGTKVTSSEKFVGKLSDIEKDFKENLLELVSLLLSPDNLIVKAINGRSLKAFEFVEYFDNFFEVFNRGNLPPPATIFETTAKFHNMKIVKEARECYKTRMTAFCAGLWRKDLASMREDHFNARSEALQIFRSNQLIGVQEYLETFLRIMLSLIRQDLERFTLGNSKKKSLAEVVEYGTQVICFLAVAYITKSLPPILR